ncbi:34219_t:CDS:1, partial [Racocetra persica]
LSEWYDFINQPNESDDESYELYESDEFDYNFDELNEFDKFNELNESDKFDELDESNEKLKIISEFMAADMRIQELSITLQQHPDVKHASRFINTHEIAQQYKKRSNQINITDEI